MPADRLGTYPFGEPLHRVVQTDRAPKRVFVLGVYSGAVHARWIAPNGKVLVIALAVASEPHIFWRGDRVEEILTRIPVPVAAGRLKLAAANLNAFISIDTSKASVAQAALDAGAQWINDVWGLRAAPGMAGVAARAGVAVS